jgi:hypothetical protein
MRDLVYLGLTVGFFGLAAVFVRACDRVLGPDPLAELPLDEELVAEAPR